MYRQNYPDDPGMHNRDPQRYSTRYPQGPRSPTFLETLKSYLLSILVGIVLICVGCGLLFWNEGRTVQTHKSLEEGLSQVESLDSENAVIEENTNKLIHVTGPLHTLQPLSDDEYGIVVTAVKLKRFVEMYQWVEYEHKREVQEMDQTRTEISYSYSKEWKDHLVDSNSFEQRSQHSNPDLMPVKPDTKVAKDVLIGSFYLSSHLIEKISNFKKFEPSHTNISRFLNIKQHMFYQSPDPNNPQVGDVRVWFEYAGLSGQSNLGPPDVASVIGRQSRNMITAFQTKSGDELEIIYLGRLTAEEIFRQEKASNVLLSWGLRFLGWVLIFIALTLTTNFITAIVSWIPILRDIVALGVLIMCLSLSISISLTVIAFGWLWYRPLFGATILALAVLPFVLARIRNTQTRASRADRMW